MFLILLTSALIVGAVLTFTYSIITYAFSRMSRLASGLVGIFMTLGTLIGCFYLMLTPTRSHDVGGLFVWVVFILFSILFGAPLGFAFRSAVISGIEQRYEGS